MQVKQVQFETLLVNVAEVSAELQFDLYELISARILHQCAASLNEDVTADVVKGVLMSSEKGFTSDVAKIVLSKSVVNGTDRIVELKDFQGKIDSYYTLVAEAVCLNLSDFFISVKNQVILLKEAMQKAKVAEDDRL